MALHELATNAGKYGTLSDVGRVEIEWSVIAGEAGEEVFRMSWCERDGKPVSPPSGKGFGSTVLGRMVRDSVDGQTELEFDAQGLCWRLECPAANALEGANGEGGGAN